MKLVIMITNLLQKKKTRPILIITLAITLMISILFKGCVTTESYTFPNGDTYTGEWKGDVKHGKGTYSYASGNRYVGEYRNGVKHGYGVFYFGEFTYEGEWINDKPVTDGTGPHAAYGHYLWGEEYNHKQQYRKAILEYNGALSKKHDKWIAFSCYNNMGIIYLHMGNDAMASECFHNALEVWPAIAYYPYMGLASLAYKNGNIEECAAYRQQAYTLVNSHDYEKIEHQYIGYDTDTLKKWVTIFNDSSQIQLNYLKLKDAHARKNYRDVERLATEILSRKYHAGLGISMDGRVISSVIEESIAALNGIVEGDELISVDGIKTSDPHTAVTALANLYDRFGDKIEIKINRRNREIAMRCHLYYPELESAQGMLEEARAALSRPILEKSEEDNTPPKITVVKPKTKRGIRRISEKQVVFEFLAGDNVGIKEVSIDGHVCEPVTKSLFEKNFFQGDVKKYQAKVVVEKGDNKHTIRALDTSGNIASREISIIHDPSRMGDVADLYKNSVAVVIGIDEYPYWPSLEFAANDAKSVKEKLLAMGFHHIIELYDQQASRLQILRLLGDTLPRLLGENDRLLVYFAGHGQTETFQYIDKQLRIIHEKEGYIIPVDGDMKNYPGTAISMSAIRKASNSYKAKHILFVFDSCYSGLGLKRAGGTKKADDYIKKMSRMKSVQIITAGGENEQVGEERGHGIFTRHLLLSLDGEADLDNDDFITASEIGTYIRPVVSRRTQNSQTPKFGWILGEGDFIFEIIPVRITGGG